MQSTILIERLADELREDSSTLEEAAVEVLWEMELDAAYAQVKSRLEKQRETLITGKESAS